MTTRNRLAVLAAAAGTITGVTCASGQALELVIKNTDAVPGLPGAWAASNMFQNPSIDMFGNVGFRGTLLVGGDVTTANNSTMWYGAPSSLSMVARAGFAAPGLSDGTTILGITSQTLPISPNGNLWFGATTSTTPPFGNGYLATGPAGSLTSVARRGEVISGAPALNGNPGQAGSNPNVNNAGQTTFYTDLVGGLGSVWVGSSANRQLAYQTGESYAGLPAGTTVRGPLSGFLINGAGTLLSGTQLTTDADAGISDQNNEVLHTLPFGGSAFTTIAREAEVAPNSGGATYARGLLSGGPFPLEAPAFTFGNGNFNNAGQVIYGAGLEGAGVDATNNAAIYAYDGSSADMFRRRGGATSAVSGATLALTAQHVNSARLNNNGQVAWTTSLTQGVADVTAANDSVLLRTAIGSSSDTLIAREGSSVPVLPGALWGTSFTSLMQNNAGQLVFASTLLNDPTDPTNEITTANDLALFAWDPTDGYMMIAREGDSLESIGINMTLTGNWMSMFSIANNEGGANALSDNGWLTLRVTGTPLEGFTDNTAIVRTLIPAPGSVVALLVGGCAMLRRRARR